MIIAICQLVRDGGAAVLVAESANPERQVWLPRSQVTIEDGMFGTIRITMPAWLARDKGFIARADSDQGRLF